MARRVHETESEKIEGHSRLLDALGFDVPARKVILQHAYETFFRFFTQFCTAIKTRNHISNPFQAKEPRHGEQTWPTQHVTKGSLRRSGSEQHVLG